MAEKEVLHTNQYEIVQVDPEQEITTVSLYPNTRSLGGKPTTGKASPKSLAREVNRLKQQKETLLGKKKQVEDTNRHNAMIITNLKVEFGNLQRRNLELQRQISELNLRNAELTIDCNRIQELLRAKDQVIEGMRGTKREMSGMERQVKALREANKDLSDRHKDIDQLIKQLGEQLSETNQLATRLGEQLSETNQLATSQAAEIEHYKQFFATLQLVVIENNKYAERVLEFLNSGTSQIN